MVDGNSHELLSYPLNTYYEKLKQNSKTFDIITRNILLNFRHVKDVDADNFLMDNGEKISLGMSRATKKNSLDKHLAILGRG